MEMSYKFRILPTEAQAQLIEQTFGNCRFLYNYYLDKGITLYREEKKTFNYYDCVGDIKNLKAEENKQWLKLGDATAYQNAMKDLQRAYDNFFSRKAGFPKFKKKKESKASYRSTNNHNAIKCVDDRFVQIPKLGLVRCKFSKLVFGRILSATISRNASGKYFVSLCCTDVPNPLSLQTGSMIGLDLGLKDFLIDSNGNKVENYHYLKHSQKKLERTHRQLSRKAKGGNNYEKYRVLLARCYEKVSNQRNDFQHKLSKQLILDNDIICIEDLNVKGMVKNHKLAKGISDCAWGEFVRKLEYKSQFYGKTLVKIDRFYPSSKLCHECGYKNTELTLDIREWTCPKCGAHLDRDINAAKNILNEGLRKIGNL